MHDTAPVPRRPAMPCVVAPAHRSGPRDSGMWLPALAVALVCGCATTHVPPIEDRPWDPWQVDASRRPIRDAAAKATVSDTLLRGYQRFLRRPEIPGSPGCKFHPSCSAYARGAFARHGALVGFLLTFDRLFIRETTSDGHSYAPIWRRGAVVLYDPP